MMGAIYRQASHVVAWLGQSDDATERALHVIARVYELVVQLHLETRSRPNLVSSARNDI